MNRRKVIFWGVLAVITAAGAQWTLRPTVRGHDIQSRAVEVSPPDVARLSAALISGDDLPPEGTRSLFDHVIAQNEALPYPFPKLLELLQRGDPQGAAPLTLLIPQGRSLLKAQADFAHPRVLAAADYQAPNAPGLLGLAPRGQLFLGFVEKANEIEVLSYNEAAGRFEFQLVQNYCENCVPRIVYARRAVCMTCHQGGAPIFPQRPWSETNGQPEIAQRLAQAQSGQDHYLGLPLVNPLAAPERFDELTDVGNFIPATQRAWIDGCGSDGADCRRQMLKLALAYLWSPTEFDENDTAAKRLRELQARHWPANGIAVAESDLRNRDPLADSRGLRGWLRQLLASKTAADAGARNNEDLEAFDRLPKLPAELDPLSLRLPKRVLHAQDLDGAFGLAALLTETDFKMLESVVAHDRARLFGLVDAMEDRFFAPAIFSRVSFMRAALATAGASASLDYCCLDTSQMSPPIAIGAPAVKIAAGSVLQPYERYCFACHRGNPSRRLDFMSGADEAAVLAAIQAKPEIRDALDWERYKGTDKQNKLMPPADSVQHQHLAEALRSDPRLLERMRETVPGLFDF